jgi:aromatic ring-opening dioxygenase catalytic subunit (LigB family)
MNLLKSEGKKRGLGAWIVMVPMILKYAVSLSNRQMGTDFEIDDNLMNILFMTGTTIWSAGSIHHYLPKVLRWTMYIEKNLEKFNEWAKKKVGK